MRGLFASLALIVSLALSGQAWAHSALLESKPAANASIAAGETEIMLKFDSRVDAKRSRLTLELPGGKRITLTPSQGDGLGAIKAKAEVVTAGPGKLLYEVLSLDGHIARGAVTFTVTGP
jgi:methionine-rich copper-binding protein CopC